MSVVYALCSVNSSPPWRRPALAAALAYVVLTAVSGWQVLRGLSSSLANDATDSLLNAAILAWNASRLPLTEAWWQFPAFAPATDTLTFSEILLGVSVIAAPLQWLTGNALTAYNATVLLSYPACALAMYALVFRLTRHAGAAFLAGLAFGFAPYRAGHLWHVQMLVVCWAPLALLGLHGYLDTGRRRWLACAGAAWLLQATANLYLLVYFSILIGFWVLWFVVTRRRWRQLLAIASALAVAAIPLVPIVLRFIEAHGRYGLSRTPEAISFHSADIAAPLCAAPNLALWSAARIGCGPEGELFIGLTMPLLCVAGLVVAFRRRASIALFYLFAAAAAWTLTWGPTPRLMGVELLPQGPFAWLMSLPGVDGLRVPARFWMVSILCLSVAMGIIVAELLSRRSRLAASVIVAAAAIGLTADGWAPITAVSAPAVFESSRLRGLTVMELPVGDLGRDAAAEFRAVTGGWRAVNGYSGYEPPHYAAMRAASRDEDPAVFASFRSSGDLNVLVPDNAPRLRALVERQGATLIEHGAGFAHYRLTQHPAPVPVVLGERRSIASVSASCMLELLGATTDGDPRTRWQCGPQVADQHVIIDFGTVATVGAVIPALGAFATDFPRRLIVETSVDGSTWMGAWDGPVLAETIAAGLTDPPRVPVTVAFERRAARFVRLRQTGRDPTWYWSIAELEVWSG